jgi:cysteinyl-tRNA synthetase
MTAAQPIHLYNTETRSKELLKPLKPGEVSLYTCGPTVYNYAHIGNFRAYTFEDLLHRSLEYLGWKVNHVMNLTDVDDKTIRGAIAAGVSLQQFTEPYIEAFFADLKALHIKPAAHYPAATAYIPSMITLIEKLMAQGMAYQGGDGSVYFPIQQFKRYGCLSHLKLSDLRVGASQRVASDEYEKDNASDFVLWKAYDAERDGNIFWESPFGKGRPGWHIECSAMAMDLLGETIDIHAGGIDNMFPHHENEIAQSEACSGKRFVNIWMHCEHLVVDGRKMSKSAGNFYTVRDILQRGYSGRELRLMLLQTHYKTPLNFTFIGLDGVRSALQRLDAVERRLEQIAELQTDAKALSSADTELLAHAKERFSAALVDDLNIAMALAALFDLVRDLNAACDQTTLTPAAAKAALQLLQEFDSVLAILAEKKDASGFPAEVVQLMQQRQQARESKEWKKADELRTAITQHGYSVEDTPHGPRLSKIEVN